MAACPDPRRGVPLVKSLFRLSEGPGFWGCLSFCRHASDFLPARLQPEVEHDSNVVTWTGLVRHLGILRCSLAEARYSSDEAR